MTTPAHPVSRYRRRILGIGAVATGALYVIGAPIYVDRVEADLERRIPAELAALGFEGVSAEFSGQDGVLTCVRPLDDPERARAAAFASRGVRAIEMARSCRVLVGEATDEGASEADATASSAAEVADADAAASAPASSTDVELAAVRDVVAADPDLGFLSLLLGEASLPDVGEPFTLFAPNNEAFDSLSADVVALLQDDPNRLQAFLEHHTATGALTGDELPDAVAMADGAELLVAVDGPQLTIDGVPIVTTDIAARNGIVHVIAGVLGSSAIEPAAVTISPPSTELAPASVTATLADGTFTLTGVLAGERERALILEAAGDDGVEAPIVDEITIDPDTGVGADVAADLAVLIEAMPDKLVSGEAGFDGERLHASGVARTEDARDDFDASARSVGVVAELDVAPSEPTSTADAAAELEAGLNAFVADNPIRFEQASAVLDDSASAVIDRIAADVQSVDGITITVEGHTDSDGLASRNLELSEERADAVRAALVDRGVPPASITAVGVGSERPILVDGVEDKDASRRVEFRVAVTP